jgi:hypothetical protein
MDIHSPVLNEEDSQFCVSIIPKVFVARKIVCVFGVVFFLKVGSSPHMEALYVVPKLTLWVT